MLTCAIRPAAPTGERDRGSLTHGLLSTAKAAPSWQLQLQLGTGDNLFDTTYVGNVAYAHLLVADFLLATHSRTASGQAAPLSHEKVDGEAFNVTNNEPMYFWDTSRYFWTAYGRDINHERLVALGETFAYAIGALAEMSSFITGRKTKMNRQTVKYACMTRTYTCDKLKQRCGYRPVVGIEEALQRSVKSFLLNDQAAENANGQVKKVQ
jgi:sterol-4alpha-carboxylate 3-dehydrogenase (decarboxylating)